MTKHDLDEIAFALFLGVMAIAFASLFAGIGWNVATSNATNAEVAKNCIDVGKQWVESNCVNW